MKWDEKDGKIVDMGIKTHEIPNKRIVVS